MKSGVIILSELRGTVRDRVLEIQRRFDPKLAAAAAPHVTITGSSGMGPISTRTSEARLREALEPIAHDTAPMHLSCGKPMRFMQTHIVVLPLDPNGPMRALHERIKRSGLVFERERFTFTPHITLNFFRELSGAEHRALLAVRITELIVIDNLSAHRTVSVTDSKKLIELPLTGKS